MGENNNENLERLQRADHDTLIRVEEKIGNLAADVKASSLDFTTRSLDHENRIRILESLNQEVQPKVRAQQLDSVRDWMRDANTRSKTVMWIASGVGGFVGFLATIIGTALGLFKH
jgi:hypothetical protein